jgi:hypothetical protein
MPSSIIMATAAAAAATSADIDNVPFADPFTNTMNLLLPIESRNQSPGAEPAGDARGATPPLRQESRSPEVVGRGCARGCAVSAGRAQGSFRLSHHIRRVHVRALLWTSLVVARAYVGCVLEGECAEAERGELRAA